MQMTRHETVQEQEKRASTLDHQLHAGAGHRRQLLLASIASLAALGSGAAALPTAAHALDMDAFMNQEIQADTQNCDPKKDPKCKPKLSGDEALCQYGQVGKARSEACKRVKEAGGQVIQSSGGKSLGGAYAI